MSIAVELAEADDKPAVEMIAAILASWSMEEIGQLIEEIEAETIRKMS